MRHRIITKFFTDRNTFFWTCFMIIWWPFIFFLLVKPSLEMIGWFLLALIATFVLFLVGAKFTYPENFKLNISNSYGWSIREALRTEYPEGIVYILESVLQELKKFNINQQPYKTYRSNKDASGSHYGFPNQANLRAIIVKAKYLCEEWSKLEQIQQIQFMEGLWNQIREEDMWLDFELIKLNKSQMAQDIYWYSYEESDHKKMSDQSRDTKDLRNPNTNRSNNNIDGSVW